MTPASLAAMPDWHRERSDPSVLMTREGVQRWLDDYVAAWQSYDEAAIAELWSADAVWHYPFQVRARGRTAITDEWMRERDAFVGEVFEAHYEPVGIDGDTVVAHGRTVYYDSPGGQVETAFDNIWLLRFDTEGRCTRFHEWYAGRPEDEPDRAVPSS